MALTQVSDNGLTNTGVTAATYGSSSAIPSLTIDAKGRVTSASTSAIDSTSIANGTSNVSVVQNGDINLTSAGTLRMQVDSTGAKMPDNQKLRLGSSSDLQIFHDGNNSRIHDTGTGGLIIQGDAQINLQSASNENYIECVSNGAVTVYHDNSAKLQTKSDGVDILGELQSDSLDVDGTSNLGGNLTVSSGNLIMHSGGRIFTGNGGNAVNPMIANGSDENTGIAFPAADTLLIAAGGETAARFNGGGSSQLYYDNVQKLETTSGGVSVTGSLIASTNVEAQNNMHVSDNKKYLAGNANDLQIYHDGSNSYIYQDGTGELRANASTFRVMNRNGNETQILASQDGAVKLYHNDTNRIETNSTGVRVTGRVEFNGSNGRIEYNNTAHTFEFFTNNTKVAEFLSGGHFVPGTNNTYDLGNSQYRWRNIYTNDLNLSNEGSANDVDGTWGNFTIQEGEDDLFLINRRSGKKYKFNLTEVN